MTRNRSKVLMIGLDSVDIDYLERRLGHLPNLRRIFESGVVRRLDSPGDVMSASVWPTFSTRSSPGEHGQYFPIQWDPGRMRLRHVESDWFESEPFWRPLARERLAAVTTLDVQMAFPNPTDAGTEIVNWGADVFGGFHCNRPDLGREIVRRFGTNVLGPDVPVEKSMGRLSRIRKTILAAVRKRGELSRWLLGNTEWNLFLTVFPECHRAGHYFWRDTSDPPDDFDDVFLEVHRAVDEEVGALLERIDLRETSVVAFSLLGIGPNHSQMHLVAPVLERINAEFAGAGDPALPVRRSPKRNAMRFLRDRLPATVQEKIALAVSERVRDWVIDRAVAGARDWRFTPGLALPTGGEGYVRFNLEGREKEGCLGRGGERYRRYRDAVREGFLSLRDASTGEPLVERITAVPERFPGPRSDFLPDLAIAWRPVLPSTEACSDRLGTFRARLKTGRGGNHRPAAFAVVAGPARELRRAASLATIVDLADLARDLAIGGG